MTALARIRCGCDPLELSGIIPGERCPHCHNLCDPWPHQTAMVRIEDARRDLSLAIGMTNKSLSADFDGEAERRNLNAAAAALIANRATNALAFAAASLALDADGVLLQPASPPGEQPDPDTAAKGAVATAQEAP